jgi:hypothetical protein
VQRLLKRLHRLVRLGRFDVGLRRTAPHRDQPARPARLPEVADVVAQLLGQIHLRLALLHVGAVDLLHVVVIEHGGARLHRGKKRLQLVEQPLVEHSGVRGRFVHVVFENVPAGEDQVVEAGQRDEFLDLRRAAIGALAEPHRSHLRERADRFRQALCEWPRRRRQKWSRPRPCPGIITPSFPFAGSIVPLAVGTAARLHLVFTSSSRDFDAALVFADLFRVAIFWPLPQ